MDDAEFDCLIVGGGAAGLSAALVFGRARRRVLLADAGEQANLPAAHIGGLLGHDRAPPQALYALAGQQIAKYPSVTLRSDVVERARRLGSHEFEVDLRSGETVRARRLLLASGMLYAVPEIPGAAALWGDTVFHCPFCHAWEVRERPIGVLGSDEPNVDRALLTRAWSDDVVLFTNGGDLSRIDRERLAAAGIPVAGKPITELVHRPGNHGTRPQLDRVAFADGSDLRRDALLVHAPLRQTSPLIASLGVSLTAEGAVEVDREGQTSMRGVYAAGDVAGTFHQVAAAIGAGSATAIWITRDLMIPSR